MFLMINFLIALSFGTHLRQFVQLTFTTWPLPCFERPPFLLFLVFVFVKEKKSIISEIKSDLLTQQCPIYLISIQQTSMVFD